MFLCMYVLMYVHARRCVYVCIQKFYVVPALSVYFALTKADGA